MTRLVDQLEAKIGQGQSVSHHQAARVAGKIMAMTPAVSLAPLHARVIGQALIGKESWYATIPDPRPFVGRARLFLDLLRTKNGRTWWTWWTWCAKPTPIRLRAAGDASEVGYGGLLPDGELGGASFFCVPFTREQAARMAAGDFSSTEREVTAMAVCLSWVEAHRPELVMSCRVQYQTDSQAAMFCVLGMKGTPPCLRAVDDLLLWCAARDVELEVVWYPRESAMQQQADALSKEASLTQWQLRGEVFASLWEEPCLGGRGPTVDAFADEGTWKTPVFYAPTWSPNAAAVDAFAQSWEGDHQLLYMNPPFHLLGRVVQKIREEQANCVLVAPVWPRWWAVALRRLPVKARRRLPHTDLFLRTGPGGGRQAKSPRYAVEAVYILWCAAAARV